MMPKSLALPAGTAMLEKLQVFARGQFDVGSIVNLFLWGLGRGIANCRCWQRRSGRLSNGACEPPADSRMTLYAKRARNTNGCMAYAGRRFKSW